MRSGVRKPAERPDRELLPDRHRNWPDCDRRRTSPAPLQLPNRLFG
jgi:hypothetical protein